MINNKYENPDVSKDLNISSFSLWNTDDSFGITGPFTWDSPLPSKFTSNDWFQINVNVKKDKIDIYIFLHIYNNEKRDRMKNVFQMSNSIKYNETEKPKRMEIGYYCKDKKEFKTLFNDQSFTNGKHIINNNVCYYLLYGGYLSTMNEPLTIGHLLTICKNIIYDKTNGNQTLVYRYFKTIKNYLSNTSDKYGLQFNNSYDNDYSGGGEH